MLLPERITTLESRLHRRHAQRRQTLSDLVVVDDDSRECLACVVDTSLSGVRVVRELERLTGERATPQVSHARLPAAHSEGDGRVFFVPLFGLAVGAAMGALGGHLGCGVVDDYFGVPPKVTRVYK
jgi:hypothetical protein